MAKVVYTNLNGGAAPSGSLFNGTKFWISQRVPMKSRFIDEVKSNGGVVVPLEKQADMLIVDHTRKDNPPDSYSYTFLDHSVRNSVLEDPENHRATPTELPPRPPGSATRSGKATRTPFTRADDDFLIQWMGEYSIGGDAGNKIFQQLEAKNLRHTWQAWRDRWVKRYRKVPPAQVPENAPPTPPQESPTSKSRNSVSQNSWNIKATQSQVEESEESDGLDEILERVPKPKTTVDDDDDADAEGEDDDVSREAHPSGTQEGDLTQQGATQSQADPDARNFHLMNDAWEQIVERYGLGDIEEESNIPLLLASAPSILRIDQDQKTEAWSFYAQANKGRTGEEWEQLWENEVYPFYLAHLEEFEQIHSKSTGHVDMKGEQGETVQPSSPTYEPGSPTDLAHAMLQAVKNAKDQVLKQQSERSPIKRKRTELEEHALGGSPAQSSKEKTRKRPRLEVPTAEHPEEQEDPEIPSTPEDEIQMDYTALEEETQDPHEEQQSSHSSPPYPRLPSETLTAPDPDTQQRIDAQLQAAIESRDLETVPLQVSQEEVDQSTITKETSTPTRNGNKKTREEWAAVNFGSPILPGLNKNRNEPESSEEESSSNDSDSDSEESDSESTIIKAPSPEIPETQTQRSGHGTRKPGSFRPAAFAKEDTPDRSSPDLFVASRDPSPQLPSPKRRLRSPFASTQTKGFVQVEIPIQTTKSPSKTKSPPKPSKPTQTQSKPTSNPQRAPSSTSSNSNSTNSTAALDAWLNKHLSAGLPFPTIETALMAASMNPVLADAALAQMRARGKSNVPGNMAGVWTEADDECLGSTDPRMRRVVLQKHGAKSVTARRVFWANLGGGGGGKV